jgi:hypothetical protein
MVRYEAVSDAYHELPFRMTSTQKDRLRALGFREPHEGGPPNWWTDLYLNDFNVRALTEHAIATLQVYGVSLEHLSVSHVPWPAGE